MYDNLAKQIMQKDFIDQLQCREVRLLAQAVFGPALMQILATEASTHQQKTAAAPQANAAHLDSHIVFTLDAQYREWLTRLDQAPEPLFNYLVGPRQHKLGIYHERLWQFFLTHGHETELIYANLKARYNGQDLGEFDLIYQHRSLGLVHLEIATKYYLADGLDNTAWEHWHGPGKTDRLDLKLKHSINKQLNLADHPAAMASLESVLTTKQLSLLNKQPLVKQLHVGGRLFYRDNNPQTDQHIPHHVNPQHLRGQWLFLHEWQALLANNTMRYCSIKKPFWLDTLAGQKPLMTVAANNDELAQRQPEMVVYQYGEQPNTAQYGFVVPNDWLSR